MGSIFKILKCNFLNFCFNDCINSILSTKNDKELLYCCKQYLATFNAYLTFAVLQNFHHIFASPSTSFYRFSLDTLYNIQHIALKN